MLEFAYKSISQLFAVWYLLDRTVIIVLRNLRDDSEAFSGDLSYSDRSMGIEILKICHLSNSHPRKLTTQSAHRKHRYYEELSDSNTIRCSDDNTECERRIVSLCTGLWTFSCDYRGGCAIMLCFIMHKSLQNTVWPYLANRDYVAYNLESKLWMQKSRFTAVPTTFMYLTEMNISSDLRELRRPRISAVTLLRGRFDPLHLLRLTRFAKVSQENPICRTMKTNVPSEVLYQMMYWCTQREFIVPFEASILYGLSVLQVCGFYIYGHMTLSDVFYSVNAAGFMLFSAL